MLNIDRSKKFTQFFEKFEKSDKRKIDFLVLHHIEATSVEHAISQLQEHKVSAHFVISEEGKVFELVDENDIAYHAGTSFWCGFHSINANSIGIEFINSDPLSKKFEKAQLQAGIDLCSYLIDKNNITPYDVVGHSDVAFSLDTNLLDRKQDPSHLFDWKFLAENGVGIFPEINLQEEDKVLFSSGDKSEELLKVKRNLQRFGYRILNSGAEFDEEFKAVVRVFNRHYNPEKYVENSDAWHLSSQLMLDGLSSIY